MPIERFSEISISDYFQAKFSCLRRMKTEKQPLSDQITGINVKIFNGRRFLDKELSYAKHHWHAWKPSLLLFLQFVDETQSTENYATLIFFITSWRFLATDCPKTLFWKPFQKKQIFVLPGYSIEQHRWFQLFQQFPRVTFFCMHSLVLQLMSIGSQEQILASFCIYFVT